MRLSKIILTAMTTAVAVVAMCVSALAATEFKTGDPTYESSSLTWYVPVYIRSDDYTQLHSYTIDFKFDTTEFTHSNNDFKSTIGSYYKLDKTILQSAATSYGCSVTCGWKTNSNATISGDWVKFLEVGVKHNVSGSPVASQFSIYSIGSVVCAKNGSYVTLSASEISGGSGSGGSSSFIRGDANGDGVVTATDATAVLRHVAEIDLITSATKLAAADANNDGSITSTDATAILRHVAELELIS